METASLRELPKQDLVYSFRPTADQFGLVFATIVPPQALLGQGAYSWPIVHAVPFRRPAERAGRGSPWSQLSVHNLSHIHHLNSDQLLSVQVY